MTLKQLIRIFFLFTFFFYPETSLAKVNDASEFTLLKKNFNTVKEIIEEVTEHNGGIFPNDIFSLYSYAEKEEKIILENLKNPTLKINDLGWAFALIDYKDYLKYKDKNQSGLGCFVVYQPLEFSPHYNGNLLYRIFATDRYGKKIEQNKAIFDFRRLEYHSQLGILKRDQIGENLKKLNLLIKAKFPDAKGNYPETGKKVLEKIANKKDFVNPYYGKAGLNYFFADLKSYRSRRDKENMVGFILYEANDCRTKTYRYRRKTISVPLGCFGYRIYGTDHNGELIF